jgi:hypothetical protein
MFRAGILRWPAWLIFEGDQVLLRQNTPGGYLKLNHRFFRHHCSFFPARNIVAAPWLSFAHERSGGIEYETLANSRGRSRPDRTGVACRCDAHRPDVFVWRQRCRTGQGWSRPRRPSWLGPRRARPSLWLVAGTRSPLRLVASSASSLIVFSQGRGGARNRLFPHSGGRHADWTLLYLYWQRIARVAVPGRLVLSRQCRGGPCRGRQVDPAD